MTTLFGRLTPRQNSGTGPLDARRLVGRLAGGLEIQADSPGAFTAEVEAFDGAMLLGTETLASDAAGDPIFIGAQDPTADITSLVFDLTACTGTSELNDFAVDTLRSINPASPLLRPLNQRRSSSNWVEDRSSLKI